MLGMPNSWVYQTTVVRVSKQLFLPNKQSKKFFLNGLMGRVVVVGEFSNESEPPIIKPRIIVNTFG